MYRIDLSKNRVSRLRQRTFSELKIREREHLQEWIANNPEILGEELLIIQKEFSGFSETQERLDLLALDKQGALVIIENKLDDSGRDVTWQALKYASYCSSLSKENIRHAYQFFLDQNAPGSVATEKLSEFFDDTDFEDLELNQGVTQRIILVAAKFRKEVTSTVLWLTNFNLRLQCFRATPFSMEDELFLSVDQVIPTPDAEDYMIGMAEKAQDDIVSQAAKKSRHQKRKAFWTQLIKEMNSRSSLYQNISPGVANWIGAGSGVRGLGLNFAASGTYGRAELWISRGPKEENEFVFHQLQADQEKIEAEFGDALVWEVLENRIGCRIKSEQEGDIFDEEQWPKMIEFMVDRMIRLEKVLRPRLDILNNKLREYNEQNNG